MRKIFFTALFILAACGTAPPVESDWCYTYNFTQSANGFNVATGQWIFGEGLQTVNGDLSFSYEYNQFVTPTLIFITVSRPTGVTGDISITTAGTIYGISSAFSVSMPTDEETVWFTPEAIGDAGKIINVTIDTGVQDLTVKSIRVEGNGATPFPSNPCSKITPTIAPTNTPAGTIAPTITPSPTLTPTSTVTPSPTATLSPTVLTPVPTNTLDPNPSPVPDPFCANLYCVYDHMEYSDAEISSQYPYWGYYRDTGSGAVEVSGGVDGGLRGYKTCSGSCNMTVDLQYYFYGSVSVTSVQGWLKGDDTYGPYDNRALLRVYGKKDGDVSWTAIYNNMKVGSGWMFFNETLSGYTTDLVALRVIAGGGRGGFAGTAYTSFDNLIINLSAPLTLPDPPTPIPTTTPQPTTTGIPSTTPIPTPTSSITPFNLPTATPFNYQPTVDLTQTTATPSTTLLPTNTDFPQSTAYVTQTAGAGTPTPSVQEIRENEAEYELLEEEQRSNNVVENLLQDILDALSGDGGTGDGDGTGEGTGGSGIGGVSDWASSISDSLYGIGELFGRVGTFFNQSVSGAKALVTSFYTAPLQPIPGLPLCITAPLQHDICAIYYILDWTLFAPETLGSFIIPLVLAIMNVIVIFRVLRYVLKLIKRTEDVTR